jgi:hypothetical protein
VSVLVFAGGFAAGGAVIAAIAAKASRAYLRGAQLIFTTEQDRQLSLSWRAGAGEDALRYAGCALEAEHGEAAKRAFDPAKNQWSLGYSLTQALIVEPNKGSFEKARPISEGMARAKLGVTWERLGNAAAANREFAAAARLVGELDVAKWRRLGEQTVDMWSQVEEKLAREKAATQGQPSK